MAASRESSNKESRTRRHPARTPEQQENRLIGLAVDLVEKQIREGTASAQVLTHYIKLGSSREKLEQERLENEVSLLKIRRETMESAQRVEELYSEAMAAFKSYSGQSVLEDGPGEDYDF